MRLTSRGEPYGGTCSDVLQGLVLQGNINGKLKMLSDFFVPANFAHVIKAVRNVAGLNEDTNTFKTPSLALKLGHNLKKVSFTMFLCSDKYVTPNGVSV